MTGTFDITRYKQVIDTRMKNLRFKPQDKDDLIQECYIELIRSQKKLEELAASGQDRPYADTICKRTILRYKKNLEGRDLSLSDKGVEREANRVPVREVRELDIDGVLDKLPPRVKDTVEAMYKNAWGVSEAAKHLGIDRTTVWRRLKAAEAIIGNIPDWDAE